MRVVVSWKGIPFWWLRAGKRTQTMEHVCPPPPTPQDADSLRSQLEEARERITWLQGQNAYLELQLKNAHQSHKVEMQELKARADMMRVEHEHELILMRQRLTSRDEMVPAPTGRVTMIFTDVQDSTQLWSDCTPDMVEALSKHNHCLRTLALKVQW